VIWYSDEDLENEHFRKGIELTEELFEAIVYDIDSLDSLDESRMDERATLLEKAADEGVWAAYAGLLCWEMFWAFSFKFYNGKTMHFAKAATETTAFDDVKNLYLPSINDEEEKIDEEIEELFKECRKEVLKNIYCLKQSNPSGLCALANYYIAICYILNIIDNGLCREENRLIGQEMINIQCLFKK
jgi:hypothetical protein